MENKMTWEEMKRQYPDEWLLVTNFELDKYGEVVKGIVERHAKKRDGIAFPPLVDKDTAFCYTGESTFRGLRSHATHHHAI